MCEMRNVQFRTSKYAKCEVSGFASANVRFKKSQRTSDGQGDGASYTINLDTSAHAVEQTAPGNYRIPTLSPTINVPYAAVPTVMLTQASFTNTLTTISRSLYNNNIVDLQWKAFSGEFSDTSLFATYYERLELSDGYYNPVALEIELAKQAYATNKQSYDKAGKGVYPNFHTLRLTTTVNIGGASAHDVIQVTDGASKLMEGRRASSPPDSHTPFSSLYYIQDALPRGAGEHEGDNQFTRGWRTHSQEFHRIRTCSR